MNPIAGTFQARVAGWVLQCFDDAIAADMVERGDRLVEEVFELLQSHGYDPSRIVALRDYVWRRQVGEPSQEVGGVMVTLAAYCAAAGLDMHEAGETELARILRPEVAEKIRIKQATKPTGSPLPIPQPEAQAGGAVAWRPMATAPRDGTMLRLLVRFTEHATEDDEIAPTIGAWSADGDPDGAWQFAGWCWTHDHFTEGKGDPIGWLPLLDTTPPAPVVPEGMVLTEAMLDAALAVVLGECGETVDTIGDFARQVMRSVQRRAFEAAILAAAQRPWDGTNG